MSELVKVKGYYVVAKEYNGGDIFYVMHSGPFSYDDAIYEKRTAERKTSMVMEILYTDIVGELLVDL